jgi:hypothetical protein
MLCATCGAGHNSQATWKGSAACLTENIYHISRFESRYADSINALINWSYLWRETEIPHCYFFVGVRHNMALADTIHHALKVKPSRLISKRPPVP